MSECSILARLDNCIRLGGGCLSFTGNLLLRRQKPYKNKSLEKGMYGWENKAHGRCCLVNCWSRSDEVFDWLLVYPLGGLAGGC